MERKPIFAKGRYKKDDKTIKLINKIIVLALSITVILILVFAINGGLTVTFDTDGGSRVDAISVKNGELLEAPANPVKEGYDFIGWSKDPDGEYMWNFQTDEADSTMTLYAVWKERDE